MIRAKSLLYGALVLVMAAGSSPSARASDPEGAPGSLPAVEMTTLDQPGILAWGTADGSFRWWIDGRLYLDGAAYREGDAPMANGLELRRGRLSIKSILWKDWGGEFDLDFSADGVEVKDMWVSYAGWENSQIKIGQHREPFSLEEVTTSRYTMFMERGLPNVLTLGRRFGASYAKWGESWRFHGGVYGQEIGSKEDNDDSEDEGYGFAGRLTFAPLRGEGRLLHVGVSAYNRIPDAGSGDSTSFKTESETGVEGEDFLDTGKIKNVEHFTAAGFEIAAQLGRVQLQGEYLAMRVSRFGGLEDAGFDGYYVQAAYLFSGRPRPYLVSEGEFTDPAWDRKNGFELALRYSTVDLTDLEAGVKGGVGENATVGLSWYVNRNVKVKAEYVHADLDADADAKGDHPGDNSFQVLQARLQFLF